MPTILNSNFAASSASLNLSRARDGLSMSLERLSSGKRINSESNNAGGLTMAYKTKGERSRTLATMISIRNALSFLQAQDGIMSTVGKVFDRMSQLRTMTSDTNLLPQGPDTWIHTIFESLAPANDSNRGQASNQILVQHLPGSDRDVPTSKHKQ
mgnify:CR=1 FL=1